MRTRLSSRDGRQALPRADRHSGRSRVALTKLGRELHAAKATTAGKFPRRRRGCRGIFFARGSPSRKAFICVGVRATPLGPGEATMVSRLRRMAPSEVSEAMLGFDPRYAVAWTHWLQVADGDRPSVLRSTPNGWRAAGRFSRVLPLEHIIDAARADLEAMEEITMPTFLARSASQQR